MVRTLGHTSALCQEIRCVLLSSSIECRFQLTDEAKVEGVVR